MSDQRLAGPAVTARWVRPVLLVAAAVALFAVIFLVTGCAATVTTVLAPPPSPSEQGNREAVRAVGSQHCGIERWPVKVGTDADAALVDLTKVVPTTIASLIKDTPVPPLPLPQASRIRPAEVTVYQVTATLTRYRIEADGDVHAVLADAGKTMIAEFPDPFCAQASRFLPQITAARAALVALLGAGHAPTDVWQTANARVTVTGVGFYDPEHGQTGGGVLPGGQVTIELHPVLGLTSGTVPTP